MADFYFVSILEVCILIISLHYRAGDLGHNLLGRAVFKQQNFNV